MPDRFALPPQLETVFDRLRRGHHLCAEDGEAYYDLIEHEADYRVLFEALGFSLERHRRDFFYCHGTGSLSETAERMAVFMLILIEALAEETPDLEERVMQRPFNISDLPHLHRERYRTYMQEVGIDGEDDLVTRVIQNLERYGFAERRGTETFRFRTPAYRFFDLCLDAAGDGALIPDH